MLDRETSYIPCYTAESPVPGEQSSHNPAQQPALLSAPPRCSFTAILPGRTWFWFTPLLPAALDCVYSAKCGQHPHRAGASLNELGVVNQNSHRWRNRGPEPMFLQFKLYCTVLKVFPSFLLPVLLPPLCSFFCLLFCFPSFLCKVRITFNIALLIMYHKIQHFQIF